MNDPMCLLILILALILGFVIYNIVDLVMIRRKKVKVTILTDAGIKRLVYDKWLKNPDKDKYELLEYEEGLRDMQEMFLKLNKDVLEIPD